MSRVVRNIEFEDLFELFLVAAISTILAIRFYLHLTDYPQLGGGSLHIAHMLWGGLLLMLAVLILLAVLNSAARQVAAVIGGIGFGTFIDELGKFLTSDNNYFFQPTFAIIYALFMVMYLASRVIVRPVYGAHEYLANAADLAKECAYRPLEKVEVARALDYLGRCIPNDPTVAHLRALFTKHQEMPHHHPTLIRQVIRRIHPTYYRVVQLPWFRPVVNTVFVFQAIVNLLAAVWLLSLAVVGNYAPDWVDILGIESMLPDTTDEWLGMAAGWVSGAFTIWGAVLLAHSRLAAYIWFKRSLLVSIFIGKVFEFYTYQLGAIVQLGLGLLLLAAVNYLIDAERHRRSGKHHRWNRAAQTAMERTPTIGTDAAG